MNNKSLRSVLTFLAVFPILMVMPLAQAPGQDLRLKEPHITLNIEPHVTFVNSTPGYNAIMIANSAPSGGFFFLNLTIPKGYNFTMPAKGKQVARYTWFNHTTDLKVIVYIISNTSSTVDIRFPINSGRTFTTRKGLPLTNIVVGTASLKFTKPTSSNVGYLNLSLGGTAGPVMSHGIVKVVLSRGVLKSPGTGKYTWFLEAKNNSTGTAFTASDVAYVIK